MLIVLELDEGTWKHEVIIDDAYRRKMVVVGAVRVNSSNGVPGGWWLLSIETQFT